MIFSSPDENQLLSLVLELCLLANVAKHTVDQVARKLKLRPRLLNNTTVETESSSPRLTALANDIIETMTLDTAKQLEFSLAIGQDRAGVLCAADPRPTIQRLAKLDDHHADRRANMSWFLMSDLHFNFRKSMGYDVDIELNEQDFEEMAT